MFLKMRRFSRAWGSLPGRYWTGEAIGWMGSAGSGPVSIRGGNGAATWNCEKFHKPGRCLTARPPQTTGHCRSMTEEPRPPIHIVLLLLLVLDALDSERVGGRGQCLRHLP